MWPRAFVVPAPPPLLYAFSIKSAARRERLFAYVFNGARVRERKKSAEDEHRCVGLAEQIVHFAQTLHGVVCMQVDVERGTIYSSVMYINSWSSIELIKQSNLCLFLVERVELNRGEVHVVKFAASKIENYVETAAVFSTLSASLI